ncbi:hypothetical protein LTR95_000218 [Oleoguttula sp. CCFEE 5521]
MPARKRAAAEAQLDIAMEPQLAPEQESTLTKLRNMWEFASLMQYIFLFGSVVKIDEDFDIEDLEFECLSRGPSEKLAQIGLALLKYVSSHRGLTPAIFDEYTRRQFQAKAPTRNPFGEDETPLSFNTFDIYTKIRVLQQLSTWTFGNADRIRGLMPADEDHLTWRMEPLGWDKDDRAYFVLDDNRLYRRSDVAVAPLTPPPEPKPKPKPKSKSKKAMKPKARGTRTSKRRKVEEDPEDEEAADEEMADADDGAQDDTVITVVEATNDDDDAWNPTYGFTSQTWSCVAITLDQYQDFLATIFRSRDPNEKQLRKAIEEKVLPILEQRAEKMRQKELRKLRELENLQKMATAKRSSRLAGKAEKEKEEQAIRGVEEQKRREIRMAEEELERQRRVEEGHESRRMTREQRLTEREAKRILHEQELARLESETSRAASASVDPTAEGDEANGKRLSERQMKTQKEQHKKELEAIEEQEKDWYFDCAVCGMHGENLDDGTHSMACEKCGVWQHSKCHKFTPKQVDSDDFHFTCEACKRRAADAKKPKIPTLKLGKNRNSGSPETQKGGSRPSTATNGTPAPAKPRAPLPEHVQRQLDGPVPQPYQAPPVGYYMNGHASHPTYPQPALPPYALPRPPSAGQYYSGSIAPQVRPPQAPWQGSPLPPPARPSSSGYTGSSPAPNGYGHSPAPAHQQQHQSMHHNAVQQSGGHPAYQPQPYTYPPQAAAGSTYSVSSSPPQQRPHQYQPYGAQHQSVYRPQQPAPARPNSSQLMNGFKSPTKRAAPPSPAAPQSQQAQQPHQSPLVPSPKTSFPPPTNGYTQPPGHSPTKSSPAAPPRSSQPPVSYPAAPSPHFAATPRLPQHSSPLPPHPIPPPSAASSSVAPPPAPPSAAGNEVAADGMSGPWPESSRAIPLKHDAASLPAPLGERVVSTPGNGQGGEIGPGGVLQGTPKLEPSPAAFPRAEGGGEIVRPVKRDV